MDRKIKTPDKDKYAHIPARQRWLYQLSDMSAGRIAAWFAVVWFLVLVGTILIVRLIMRYTR